MVKVAVWKAVENPGMEYLWMDEIDGVQIKSVVIGVEHGKRPFRLDYSLRLSIFWGAATVKLSTASYKTLELSRDTHAHWFDGKGKSIPELDDCIDVDISATPFTNTLPIRRLQWQVGQSEVFKMVYILVPELKVSVKRQRYTCLDQTDHGATFRYENMDDDFKADITVDRDGLVLNYPGLFERVI